VLRRGTQSAWFFGMGLMPRPSHYTVVATCAVLTGCFSSSIAQTPGTVPQGKFRVGVGVAATDTAVSDDAGMAPELSVRFGVHDRVDVGLKTNLMSIEAQVKGHLLRGDFDMSLAVSGATGRDDDDDLLVDEGGANAGVPETMHSGRVMLLTGTRLGPSVDLVLMADSILGIRVAPGGDADTTSRTYRCIGVGGGIGILIKGSSQFLPEVVFTHFLDGNPPMTAEAFRQGDTRIQFTVTGLLGGFDNREREDGGDSRGQRAPLHRREHE
jgi:hypothetical protein